jgi:hypothetical protein
MRFHPTMTLGVSVGSVPLSTNSLACGENEGCLFIRK